MNNCVTSTLAPFQPSAGSWTPAHVAHLYRSFGHGATIENITAGLQLSPTALVNQLLDEAVNTPQPDPYYWSEWTTEDYYNDPDPELRFRHFEEISADWMKRAIQFSFQQKMTLFWHDHFATEEEVYSCNRYVWRYYKLLHEYAFGNFRTFVERMGTNEAMLVYLDGNDNIVGAPNENYARELMELFTMGENNGYTQTDIEEVAKALTGWRVSMYECGEAYYDSSFHDNSIKNIFGQSGNFNYDDVHQLIFSVRRNEVATYICEKLYQHFVYREVDESIVAGLAQTFIDSNWEIIPVLRQLLRSEHFYETVYHGAKIKTPVALVSQLMVQIGFDMDTDVDQNLFGYLDFVVRETGQDLFNPPNVAGWPGNRFWLSENSLAYRWSFCQSIINNFLTDQGYLKLRNFALAVSPSPNDPAVIASACAAHILGYELAPNLKEVATLYLKAGIPENYFTDGSWNLYWDEAPQQLSNMLRYLIQVPEFQLS